MNNPYTESVRIGKHRYVYDPSSTDKKKPYAVYVGNKCVAHISEFRYFQLVSHIAKARHG